MSKHAIEINEQTTNNLPPLLVLNNGDMTYAREISDLTGITIITDATKAPTLYLCLDENGLTLSDGELTLQGDFGQMKKRLMPNNLNHEMLVKAAKIKSANSSEQLTLIDATAGMGDDSLLLAASGFKVILFERDPVIAALLYDTLTRAMKDDALSPIVRNMELRFGDSITKMKELNKSPDVILLDPMFPERQKSGLIKKKFQLLQQLEQPCSDEFKLIEAALYARPTKIVVKRPAKGPFLANMKPDYSYPGKAIRYDCYINLEQYLKNK